METLILVLILLGIAMLVGHKTSSLRRQSGTDQSDREAEQAGGDERGVLTRDLSELETAERQLVRLQDAGLLPADIVQRVRAAIEQRRRQLRETPSDEVAARPAPAAMSSPPPAPAPKPPPPPPVWKRLETLLAACATEQAVRRLSERDQQRALSWHGLCGSNELAMLSHPAQLALARLLSQSNQAERALAVYRRLLAGGVMDPGTAGIAMEAGRLAASEGRNTDAVELLRRALRGDPIPDVRREAEALLYTLEGPAPAPAPPAPPPAPAPAVRVGPPAESPASSEIPTVAPPARVPAQPASSPVARPRPAVPAPVAPSVARPARPRFTPPRVQRPQRSFRELLAMLMEEPYIFWGEFAAGLLIVGFATGLAINVRNTLGEHVPYFPFVVLAGITASAFGLGRLSLGRWGLEATGHGLLVIGLLLVPLNFLVLTALFPSRWGVPVDAAAAAVAIGVLGWLSARAVGRLVAERWPAVTLALVGGSAGQLPAPWLLDADASVWWYSVVGALPLACYLAGAARFLPSSLLGGPSREPLGPARVRTILGFLAASAFALVVGLGSIVARGNIARAMEGVAPLVALAALPLLLGGLVVHRGLADSRDLAAWRTIGTATMLSAIGMMVIALGLAWPAPASVVATAAVNFTVLTLVAVRGGLPLAHAAALPCGALASLMAWHWVRGHLAVPPEALGGAVLGALVSAESGTVLFGLFLVMSLVAERGFGDRHSDDRRWYDGAALAAALASLLLVTVRGASGPGHAALVYAGTGARVLDLARSWRRRDAGLAGLVLLGASTLWALRWGTGALTSWWGTAVAVEALLMGWAAVELSRPSDGERGVSTWRRALAEVYASPLRWCAFGLSAVAAALAVAAGSAASDGGWSLAHVVTGAALVGLYIRLALATVDLLVARVAGALAIGTVVAAAGWIAGLVGVPVQASVALGVAVAGLILLGGARLAGVEGTSRGSAAAPVMPIMPTIGETAEAASLLALLLTVSAPTLGISWLHPATGLALTATAFLLARTRGSLLTGAGSALGLGTIVHVLALQLGDRVVPQSWCAALLTHATLSVAAVLAVRRTRGPEHEDELAAPLRAGAVVTSALAALLAFGGTWSATVYLLWLAAVWLALA